MSLKEDGTIYIIFGDSSRSDGSNIYGIFKTLKGAEEEQELLQQYRPFEDFHIEEHWVQNM